MDYIATFDIEHIALKVYHCFIIKNETFEYVRNLLTPLAKHDFPDIIETFSTSFRERMLSNIHTYKSCMGESMLSDKDLCFCYIVTEIFVAAEYYVRHNNEKTIYPSDVENSLPDDIKFFI